jgi:hypothetical protein
MSATEQLRRSLKAQLQELDREAALLRNALEALDGNSNPTPTTKRLRSPKAATNGASAAGAPAETASETSSTPAPKARKPAQRKRRAKPARATEVVPAGKLELLLSETNGVSTAVLAEHANGDRDQVLTLLREMEAAGRVRRTGERRGTRWHVITDEDRIQERAAELATQSRSMRKPT